MIVGVRRLLAVVAVVIVAGACSGNGEADGVDSAVAAETTLEAIIIDVRTPEEFIAGHVRGALLIDFKDASFDAKIAELDPNAEYIVYCRSGNRSAQAAARMREAGIGNIVDLGSLENASAKTGIDIVTD
jgi:rhodanese-related sulfurtransferase